MASLREVSKTILLARNPVFFFFIIGEQMLSKVKSSPHSMIEYENIDKSW